MTTFDNSNKFFAALSVRINGCRLYLHKGAYTHSKFRQVSFDLRAGNSNLAKSLGEKVTMQCIKMKIHTDACCPCKINKTSNVSPILVTSIHKTDSFRLQKFIWDSHIFQNLSLAFCQSVEKHLHFLHIEVTLIIKGNRFVGSSIV